MPLPGDKPVDSSVVVALIGLAGGVLAMGTAHLAPAILKKLFNGSMIQAEGQRKFYDDLQKRLDKVEAELEEERAIGAENSRTLAELSALIQAHLQGHPQLETLLKVLEAHELRTRRPA